MVRRRKTRSIDNSIISLFLMVSLLISGCDQTLFYIPETQPGSQAESSQNILNTALNTPSPNVDIDSNSSSSNQSFSPPPTITPEIPESAFMATPLSLTIDPTQNAAAIPNSRPSEDEILYYTQAGDTLDTIAIRFGVWPEEITTTVPISLKEFIPPNQLLIIPNKIIESGSDTILLPDSEIVNSPSVVGFDVQEFIDQAGGFLSTYNQSISDGRYTGAQILERVAYENSINPRFLLALLEYQSNWVYGWPPDAKENNYPIGLEAFNHRGLYRQLSWAVQHLSVGYYGWRAGLVITIEFPNKDVQRLAPSINAGTVAIQNMFSKLYEREDWEHILYSSNSFTNLYMDMFGDPWFRARTVEPLYPPNLQQPFLELPFRPGYVWSLSGGPHSAWGPNGALAALDFAPSSTEHGCVKSEEFVTASAPGLVVRSGNGVVLVDLDGDGHEQTGWSVLYMHIAKDKRIPAGTWVNIDDKIGYPSCEGGTATGTHVHIARKYNGEWILADGPVPFVLAGWTARSGYKPYLGSLVKGDQIVLASDMGEYTSRIIREKP